MSANLIIINDSNYSTSFSYSNLFNFNIIKPIIYRVSNSPNGLNYINNFCSIYNLLTSFSNLLNLHRRNISIIFLFRSNYPNQTLPSSYISLILLSSILPIYIIIKRAIINSPIFLLSNHKINILYITTTTRTLIILAIILLITIIIVVKITVNFKGPLRPFK